MNFNKQNLAPASIVEELQSAVLALTDEDGWSDYFEGGAGRTVIELIAGSQAIKNHYNLMRVRESSLQYAKLDSSITELAVNKGVYRPPAKTFIGELNFSSVLNGTIQKGDVIGTYGNHSVIAYESKNYVVGAVNSIQFIIGNMNTEILTVDEDVQFSFIDVVMDDKYITGEFETLTINYKSVDIIDEQINLYDENITNTVLRLVYEYRTKMIFGDDIIGKLIRKNDEVEYTYMTFQDSLIMNFKPTIINFDLMPYISLIDSIITLREATGYLNKEDLRKVAIRNSVDGRWVLPQDYRNGLLRDYGEYLYDILVVDKYPAEKIYYLFIEGTLTNALKSEIGNLIENKRGNAVLVEEYYIDCEDSNNYQDVSIKLRYVGDDTEDIINDAINSYKELIEYKFKDGEYTITSDEIAVDLTSLLSADSSGKFYEIEEKEIIMLELTFIRAIDITYTK